MTRKRSIRPAGDVITDMEPYILELTEGHHMQWYEVLNLIHGYLQTHCPDSQETYLDGTHPEFYYGSKRE